MNTYFAKNIEIRRNIIEIITSLIKKVVLAGSQKDILGTGTNIQKSYQLEINKKNQNNGL